MGAGQADDWVAIVKPDSPGAVVQRFEFDPKTGKEIRETSSPAPFKVSGTFQVISRTSRFSTAVPDRYEWDWLPFSEGVDRSDNLDLRLYNPFIYGGTIAFRFDTSKEGKARYADVHLIPTEWGGQILPGQQFIRANPALFAPENVSTNLAKLENLLEDKNPFIAVAACRTLAAGHQLGKPFVNGPLKRARGFKQAIFTFLLAQHTSDPELAKLAPAVADLAKNAPDSVSMKGLVLGAYAAGLGFRTAGSDQFAKSVLRAAAYRQKALGARNPDRTYVLQVLAASNIQPDPTPGKPH